MSINETHPRDTEGRFVLADPNADTDKVFASQKKYIWPVAAVLLIIAAYLFGTQQSVAGDCRQAVVKADQGFELAYDAFGSIADDNTTAGHQLAEEIGVVMDDYWALSSECQGEG